MELPVPAPDSSGDLSEAPLRASWRGWVIELALVVAGVIAAWVWASRCRALARVYHPVGADAWMWGLAALDFHDGRTPILPPGFLAVLSLFKRFGLTLSRDGIYAPQIAFALTPAVVYVAVRQTSSARIGAALAALLCILNPDLLAAGLTFQPEAWTALGFALAVAAVAVHLRFRSYPSLLLVALASTWQVLVREHGLLTLPLMLVIAGLAPPLPRRLESETRPARSRIRHRATAMAIVLVLTQLGPLFLGLKLVKPATQWPWHDKAGVPMRDLRQIYQQVGFSPTYLRYTVVAEAGVIADTPAAKKVVEDYERVIRLPDPVMRLKYTLLLNWRWSRALSGDLHVWILAGLAVLVGVAVARRRPALLLPALLQLSVLPSLLLWSQRRHVIVVLPVVFFSLGMGFCAIEAWVYTRLSRLTVRLPGRIAALAPALAVLLVGAALGGLAQRHWLKGQQQNLGFLLKSTRERDEAIRFGRRMLELAPDGHRFVQASLRPPEPDYVALGAEMPRLQSLPGMVSPEGMLPALAPAWRSYVVTPSGGRPSDNGTGWKVLFEQDGYIAWSFRPDIVGEERRCLEGVVLRSPIYFEPRQGGADVQLKRLQIGPAPGCPEPEPRPPGAPQPL